MSGENDALADWAREQFEMVLSAVIVEAITRERARFAEIAKMCPCDGKCCGISMSEAIARAIREQK